MITTNKIIDGISLAINEEFGDDYEIYTEDVKQGLKEPCFSIVFVNSIHNQFFDKKYFSKNLFCINYFPKSLNVNVECLEVKERLISSLEYITIDGDLLRGTHMSCEIIDEVFVFMINFDLFTLKENNNDDISMGTFGRSINVRKEDTT